jgi:membrane protease YdiL (CAAX protease family)
LSPEASAQLIAAGLFILGLIAVALGVQGYVIFNVASKGGRVRTDEFRMPDVLVAVVLILTLGGLQTFSVLRRAEETTKAIKIDTVLPNALFIVLISAGVAAFLRYRGLDLVKVLGLKRLSLIRVIGWAFGLFISAIILAGLASALSSIGRSSPPELQPLVVLFREVAEGNDWKAIGQILLAGVVFAPLCEEFLFRGFFYALGKRYLGPIPSGALTSLIFAASHLSLPAFPGLFVLALCLNLAYERTGSLWVPIGMHALFNFTSLCVIYCQARGMIPTQ